MRTQVRPMGDVRLARYALIALVTCGGCSPRSPRWTETGMTIQPQPPRAEAREEPRGYLVIQVPPNVGEVGDQEVQHYPPVYLYDQNGTYLEQLPNNTEYPTALAPGAYIVLVGETDPLGEFHQVQVRVENGKTTAVSLADIDGAPHFWELSRALFH